MGQIEGAIEDIEKSERSFNEWAANGFKKDLPKVIMPVETLLVVERFRLPSRYRSRCMYSGRRFG